MDHQQLFGIKDHAFIGPLVDACRFIKYLHPNDYVNPCMKCAFLDSRGRRTCEPPEVCVKCPSDGVYVPEALAPVFRIWRAAQHDT